MKVIKKKLDVKHFIVHFSDVADGFDKENEKYYLVVNDDILDGTITFMLYPYLNKITYHRVNKHFCDWREIDIDTEVLWGYRRLLNREIRKRMVE